MMLDLVVNQSQQALSSLKSCLYKISCQSLTFETHLFKDV